MKKIKEYVDAIEEEIEGAKKYAEKAIEYNVAGDSQKSAMFKEMAYDELKHAKNIHTIAVEEIAKLSKVFVPPAFMQEEWDRTHKIFVENTAWVKQMLEM